MDANIVIVIVLGVNGALGTRNGFYGFTEKTTFWRLCRQERSISRNMNESDDIDLIRRTCAGGPETHELQEIPETTRRQERARGDKYSSGNIYICLVERPGV